MGLLVHGYSGERWATELYMPFKQHATEQLLTDIDITLYYYGGGALHAWTE